MSLWGSKSGLNSVRWNRKESRWSKKYILYPQSVPNCSNIEEWNYQSSTVQNSVTLGYSFTTGSNISHQMLLYCYCTAQVCNWNSSHHWLYSQYHIAVLRIPVVPVPHITGPFVSLFWWQYAIGIWGTAGQYSTYSRILLNIILLLLCCTFMTIIRVRKQDKNNLGHSWTTHMFWANTIKFLEKTLATPHPPKWPKNEIIR